MKNQQLKITPLGGVGEVGSLNCMVYETQDEAVVVDCGTMFPDQSTLGVDIIIPDFTYLHDIQHKLKALILTHGHEDHLGATPFLLQAIPLPVYGTPFTLGILKKKLDEYTFKKSPKLHRFKPGDSLKIGSFEIETIFVNHSIIDASALAFKTPGGYVAHVTDWKVDKTPLEGETTNLKKFSELGKKGVLALFSDSTNAGSNGATLSEKEVFSQLKKICSQHSGRIIVTLFSSNTHRVRALIEIAKKLKRKISLVGRSMKENTEIARQLGRLSFEEVDFIDVAQTDNFPDNQVMVLVTGTQGEPRSALTRMAMGAFKPFKIKSGDMVLFSSKIIPGNEKNIFFVINHLSRHGAKILYESFHEIHTSGHAHREELKLLIKKLKPNYFIPIHGEYFHLVKHAELANQQGIKKQNIFIIENGTSLICEGEKISKGAIEVPTGRVFVDESRVGEISGLELRDRKKLATAGIVMCVLIIDHKNGEIIRGPELISRGFIQEEENQALFTRAKESVLNLLESFNFETRTDMAEVQEEVRLCLRRFFNREVSRKPVIIPVVQEV